MTQTENVEGLQMGSSAAVGHDRHGDYKILERLLALVPTAGG